MPRSTLGTFALLLAAASMLAVMAVMLDESAHAQTPLELDPLEVRGRDAGEERPGLIQATTVLSEEKLRLKTGSTIGETLSGELGVNNASFGPGVGLPVLRGLSGSRVRVMQDGIATHDASTVSADHASTVEASLAEQVVIIRGPATLLYGSGASGGVVNVVDNRIPDTLPPARAVGMLEPRASSNGGRHIIAARLETHVENLAIHLDAFQRHQSEVEIPGLAIDEDAVRTQFGLENRRNASSYIPNTDAQAHGGSLGASWIAPWGHIGAAVNVLENTYGLPPAGESDPPSPVAGDVHGGDVRIDLSQTRIDTKATLNAPLPMMHSARLRMGYVDYEHTEFENDSRGTRFVNRALEARAEVDLEQLPLAGGNLTTTLGAQLIDREFSALGAEAFVPRSDIRSLGAFGLQRYTSGAWSIEFGARAEHQRVEQTMPIAVNDLLITRTPIEHLSYSVSAAATVEIDRSSRISLSLSRALRSPDVQELLSLGPHFSTRTFDRGDARLQAEKFVNVDLGVEVQTLYADIGVNLFYNSVEDFIYQRSTGFFFDAEDGQLRVQCARLDLCFPVTDYQQEDAVLKGFEAQIQFPVVESMAADLQLSLFADFVRGTLQDSKQDIPRMPPLRLGTALTLTRPHWRGELRLTHVHAQNRPGENETPTDGHLMLNASLWHGFAATEGEQWSIFLRGSNLLDAEVRNPVSFLRSFAPEPGRAIELGLRAHF